MSPLGSTWRSLGRPLTVLLALLAAGPAASQGAEARDGGIPILLYHRFGPTVPDAMTVRTSVFEEQMAWLGDHGYRVLPLRAIVDDLTRSGTPTPRHAVAIVIDDGHRSVYEVLWPIIRRDRIPVTLFLYPSAISNAAYALTWEQVAEMEESGLVDIQSHTFWHPNFNHERERLTPGAYHAFVMAQLAKSREILHRRTGSDIDMLAWPFGIHDPTLEEMAREAGYRAAFTLDRRPVGREPDLMALPRYLMTDADRGPRFEAIIEGTGR